MCGSHINGKVLTQKTLRSEIFWPSVAKDAQDHVRSALRPMRSGYCRGSPEDAWGKEDGGLDTATPQRAVPEVGTSKAFPLPASSQSSPVRSISLCLGHLQVLVQQGYVLGIIAEFTIEGREGVMHGSVRASCMALSGEGFGDSRPTTGLIEDEEGGGEEEGEANFTPPADLALLGRGDIILIVRFVRAMR
ncbi:hypothetical protein LIER_41684 [Lithospermum erythrorhizon]|uniref:Integrase zinc-binding domain-containing protein n=1 Tax=Lithospermum erythrorhizon TaxID=34254 RepID=A0AAV3RFY5_LITER